MVGQMKTGISPGVRDTDRDGCADDVESADVDGDGLVGTGDRLATLRAVWGVAPLTHPLSADEMRTVDQDGDGFATLADSIMVARIAFSTSFSWVLDYNLFCSVPTNGYLPN